jgi:hypothetical protein
MKSWVFDTFKQQCMLAIFVAMVFTDNLTGKETAVFCFLSAFLSTCLMFLLRIVSK